MKADIITVISGLVGTLGFALMFRVQKRKLPFTALGGALCCLVWLISQKLIVYEFVQYMIASAFATLYSEIFARILKTPSSTFLLPSIIPLVPGGALYYTMNHVVSGDFPAFYDMGFMTLEIAGGIAGGILLVSAGFNYYTSKKSKRMKAEQKH